LVVNGSNFFLAHTALSCQNLCSRVAQETL
jgi:hypothetical protein